MTPLEHIDAYKIGLELGLYELDDLSDFLDRQIAGLDDVPYIYIDLALAIPLGIKHVFHCISEYFSENRYTPENRPDCPVEKSLIGLIRDRYQSGEATLEQTCRWLHWLSLHFEPYSAMNAAEDYYTLACEGIVFSIDQVENMVEAILLRGTQG
ncbi:hypothetical protein [Anaerotruncus colihominis]|uniref:Uncharacterized protein n=1 Tax=Anaerotruncus colihominis TaxID=169435 RepID=A0A845T3R4_9FIRM|nr:hypothetical protein [Anaerotruncus colihominis]MCR2024372.1 hypothetical protein [Anaerotruncus colihominis]NDO39081.1 hypothetical protein [Anaerotruncus colihominis]